MPMKKEIIELLEDLQDPDPCGLDHHGNCQAHGWFQKEVDKIKTLLIIIKGENPCQKSKS